MGLFLFLVAITRSFFWFRRRLRRRNQKNELKQMLRSGLVLQKLLSNLIS